MRCEECGREADGTARGWRATSGNGSLMVAVFCPECAEREFGDELHSFS
jgi:hypothetical protein